MAKIPSRGRKGLYKPISTGQMQPRKQTVQKSELDKNLDKLCKKKKETFKKIKADPSLAIRSVKIIRKASDKK